MIHLYINNKRKNKSIQEEFAHMACKLIEIPDFDQVITLELG